MKQKFVLFIFVGFLGVLLCSYAYGPAVSGYDRTGAEGGTTGCGGGCHSAGTGATSVELDSAGVAKTVYYPGVAYTVKVSYANSLAGAGTWSHFGFELATVTLASAGTGGAVQAGTWGAVLPADVQNTLPATSGLAIPIIEHDQAIPCTTGTGGPGSTYVESIPWTAPVAGTGSVKIFGIINKVNFDGTNGGDAYLTPGTATITEHIAVVSPSVSIAQTPVVNPACAGSNISFTATPTNGGGSPTYQWMLNRVNIGGVTSSNTFTTAATVGQDTVTCMMNGTTTSNSVIVTVDANVTPTITITTPHDTICSGTTESFGSSATYPGVGATYVWKVNGTTVGTNSPTYSSNALTNGALVTCTLTSTATCASPTVVTSNTITMTVNSTAVPTISISTPDTTICTGTSVTFTAAVTNQGAGPTYVWKVNGTTVGTNSSTYTTNALTNGAVVTCQLTSNAPCASPTSATSASITMIVTGTVAPTITIRQATATACSGSPDTFTSVITNGGLSPSFQWRVNGTNTGTNSSSFISSGLATGNTVMCVLTSSSSCAVPDTARSNALTVTINPILTPAVSISTARDSICQGAAATFTATTTNPGASPSYQWQVNGNNAGTNSRTFNTSTLTNGSTVSCTLTSDAVCASPQQVTGTPITMTVIALPTVTITPSGSVTVCSGDSLELTAGGATTYLWSNTSTAAQIWVRLAGTYDVTGTSAGCSAVVTPAAIVTVHTPATPTIGHSGNTLTATAGLHYEWIINDTLQPADTGMTLNITETGTYAVIVTDASGCPAQSVNYPEVYQPNGISSTGADPVVRIYPVPNQGTFIVANAGTGSDIAIYDIYGQLLYHDKITSDHQQISAALAPAIYFVTVSDGAKTETIKMQVDKE